MKLIVLSVRDEKVEAFLPPFTARAVGEGIRIFETAIRDPNSGLAKHVADYVLYRVGTFDDVSGLMAPQEPERLISGLEAAIQSDVV